MASPFEQIRTVLVTLTTKLICSTLNVFFWANVCVYICGSQKTIKCNSMHICSLSIGIWLTVSETHLYTNFRAFIVAISLL